MKMREKSQKEVVEKPSWVEGLVRGLAEIHAALPAYFCTGADRDILVPLFYEEGAELENWMRKHRLIRLSSGERLDYEVRKALCIIFAYYTEEVLLYPIWRPEWAFSTYKRYLQDPTSELSQALAQAYGAA